MNWSSLSKAQAAIGVMGLTGIVAIAAQIFSGQASFVAIGALLVGLGGAVAGLLYCRRVAQTLRRATRTCALVAKGDFEERITYIDESGDLGEFLWSVNELTDSADAFVRESSAVMNMVSRNRYFRHIVETGMHGAFRLSARTINDATSSIENKCQEFHDAVEKFESGILEIVESVARTATQFNESAAAMDGTAETTTERASRVAKAAEEATTNAQTVAVAADELDASCSEIDSHLKRSATTIESVVEIMGRAHESMAKLEETAARIGEIVDFITEIANQTNLLALNATIEAARAGEAGKGFAVVASEVKSLAKQTTSATEQIIAQIEGMQTSTEVAVKNVGDVGRMVNEVSESFTGVSGAVQQQSAATREIAQSVDHVSAGAQGVTASIKEVSDGAMQTSETAKMVREGAHTLSEQSQRLRAGVDGFLADARNVA
jgi:methyl-accepting chemotaxis protein